MTRRGLALVMLLVLGGGAATGCRKVLRAVSSAVREEAASQPAGGGPAPLGSVVVFSRYVDRTERAFKVLVPEGWTTHGGIVRVNPITARGGPAQAIAAKVDFTVTRDAAGTAAIRWLPDMLYADLRGAPARQFGLFPDGSNYNGMEVRPRPDPESYLLKRVFPALKRRATGLTVVDKRRVPAMAAEFRRLSGNKFSYQAALVTVRYEEDGTAFEERLFTVIESLGAGLWQNRSTLAARAPVAELPRLEKVMGAVVQSVVVDPGWMAREVRGQAQRAGKLLEVQRYVQRIDEEIAAHRQRTNAEINRQMFNTLTGQEEYVNPHTGEVERDTSQWKHRWQDATGRIVYSDQDHYDPNHDPTRNLSGFKRSAVRTPPP